MSRKVPKAKRDECVRIRQTEQLSTPVIARRVGLSNASVYKILRKYPWFPLWPTEKGGRRATWTRAEVAILRSLWAVADEQELLTALPGRRFASIGRKASELGLRRRLPGSRKNKRFIHPVCVQLREAREAKKLTRPQVSARCGYHINEILGWELGKATPKLNHIHDWAAALGLEITLTGTRARSYPGRHEIR